MNGALKAGIETQEAQHKKGCATAHSIAVAYARLRNNEQAFRWLQIAYQEHDNGLLSLRTHPAFDSIRTDSRFAELVRKVGLPQ